MNVQVPRIVVVGGGAGGLNLVTRLSRSLGRKGRADITLVDENLSHIWKPSLHEFAAGTKGPEEEISFLEHCNRNGYKFRLGRFAGIDYQERWVMLDPVLGAEDVELSPARAIPYDVLVLAIGSRSNDFGTPGVMEHCLFLDTPTEAKRLQSEILNLCLRMETGALENEKGSIRLAIVAGAPQVSNLLPNCEKQRSSWAAMGSTSFRSPTRSAFPSSKVLIDLSALCLRTSRGKF